MGTTYDEFLYALRMRESTNNYSLVNTLDFLGAYQFGEAALIDLGLVNSDGNDYDNDYSGGWTGKFGIDSKAEFLATPAAQDGAVDEWFPIMWRYLTAIGADAYLGQTVGGAQITSSGLLAGAHLLGAGAVLDWLESGGTLGLTDAYGTPISEYIDMFSGYTMPFPTGDVSLDAIADQIAVLPDALQTRIENIFATDGALLLGADNADDLIAGRTTWEVIAGNGGSDELIGRDGSDALLGGDGNDVVRAGVGWDVLIGGDGSDKLLGGIGRDLLIGGDLDDTLYGGSDDDRLYGQTGNDVLGGALGRDRLFGGAGNDILRGYINNDYLYGGTGNDILLGQNGRDLLFGGAGNDRLTGGLHADLFVFHDGGGDDVVLDFEVNGLDRIRLAAVDSITGYTDLMANHAHQVGDDVVIETDAGESLTLRNVSLDALTAADFVF